MTHTIIIIEDDATDFDRTLQIVVGIQEAQDHKGKTTIEISGSSKLDPCSILAALSDIVGQRSSFRIERIIAVNDIKERLEAKRPILALVDLFFPGGDYLDDFQFLLQNHIPTLVLSQYLSADRWGALHSIAEGRHFGVLTKQLRDSALDKSEPELRERDLKALANSVAGLLYLHPAIMIKNKLRHVFGGALHGENDIAGEVAKRFYPSGDSFAADTNAEKDVRGYLCDVLMPLQIKDRRCTLFDEVSPLKAVIMHEPGDEVERVTADNCGDYLFNQPVNIKKFKEQHQKFRVSVEEALGKDGLVLTVDDLLGELLGRERELKGGNHKNEHRTKLDARYRNYLVARFVLLLLSEDGKIEDFWELLSLSVDELIVVAFSGVRKVEGLKKKEYFDAIPNLVFTRDWGFTAHNKVFLSKMSKKARKRESAIAEFLFRFHPIFSSLYDEEDTFFLVKSEQGADEEDCDETVEGGDILFINRKTIVIGFSDRTKFPAIKKFARLAFEKFNELTTIIATSAPLLNPKSMHLDTFMGFLSEDIVMLDGKTFTKDDQPANYIFRRLASGRQGEQPDNRGSMYIECYLGAFTECLAECVDSGKKLEIIRIDQPGEQYDDALNVFAVAPNKVFIYGRSNKTIALLNEKGWVSLSLVWETDSEGNLKLKDGLPRLTEDSLKKLRRSMESRDTRTLFLVDGDELALARGGPHCMTFPVWRVS